MFMLSAQAIIPAPRQSFPNASRPADPVTTRAQTTLASSEYKELRQLRCEFADGVLSLRGTVSSFFMKQLAQESLRGLDGVRHIANHLHVDD